MKKILLLVSIIILTFSTFYSQTLNDSLVAHYLLNGNGNDNIGSNHGTVNGVTPTSDRNANTNSAYLFDGINDWINIGSTTDLEITGDITVSAWVKTPSSWPSTYHDPQIYSRYTYSLSTSTGVNFYLNDPHLSSRGFAFILKTGSNSWGNDFATSSTTLQLNTWYFVVGVRESNLVKVYVNGVLEGTDIGSSSPINYGASPIASIGEKNGDSPGFFNGVIDDVRIYKRALSTPEIQTLHTFVGIDENNNLVSNFSIYPNPTSDYLNIMSVKMTSSIDRIEIYSINGQIVKSYSKSLMSDLSKLNISDLADDTYFLKILDTDNNFQTIKFIKTKH